VQRGVKTPVAHATTSSPPGSFVDISVVGTTKPKIIGCVVTDQRLREPTPVIVDTAAMTLSDALMIPARALTSGFMQP
jgi:hypothetical protein